MNANELIHELERAFPARGLDGGVSLRQALLLDDWEDENSPRMRDAYQEDVTHDWRAIPELDLDECFNSFSVFTYLDDKGWQYYLPAALRRSLKDAESRCEFYTRISLLPGKQSGWDLLAFTKRLALSKEQGRIIAKTLLFLRKSHSSWYLENPEAAAQLEELAEAFEA